jgi:hypothetical protein
MRPGEPLTRQRSEFLPSPMDDETVALLTAAGCTEVVMLRRQVHDGELRVIRSCDPPEYLWHLSVSHWPRGLRASRRARRYPSWDELAHARYELLPLNIDVVMHLPPPEEFVSVEDTTFHLHEHRREDK